MSKLLRNGSSGVEEEEKEEKKKKMREMNFFSDFVSPIKYRRKEVYMLKLPASHSPAVSENDQPLLY